MKKIRKVIALTAVAGILVILVVRNFMAFAMRSRDDVTGRWLDGLGRELEPSPSWSRWLFGADSQWAGWQAALLEIGIWVGSIVLIRVILLLSLKNAPSR